jgi:outer membrane protein
MLKTVVKFFIILFLTSVFPVPSKIKAATIEYLNLNLYNLTPHGTVEDRNGTGKPGLRGDLHLSRTIGYSGFYSLENVPFIPDFRVEYKKLHFSGHGEASKNFTFKDTSFSKGDPVSSKLDIDDFNLTFYYQPLNYFNNNGIKLEIGPNVNLFHSEVKVANKKYSNGYTSESTGALIVSGYVGLEFNPIYYLTYYVKLRGLSLSKNKANLFLVGVKYSINDQLSLNGGWIYERKKLKDVNDINLDISTKGYFLGVELVW